MLLPRYPVYIPSKGRFDSLRALTAKCLLADEVPFQIVVEPPEAEAYRSLVGEDRVLVLPFADLGQGSIPARNWIKDHAAGSGVERFWQLDDNMRGFRTWFGGRRIRCRAGVALRVAEDFADRYVNVAIAGLDYTFMAANQGLTPAAPFILNTRVYSCTLVKADLPFQWRGRYNEDTDLCLQALAGGWCTVLFKAFMCDKVRTMTLKGGNTDQLYKFDGRTKMARELERRWPGVVRTYRRFGRAQHYVDWAKFRTPLQRKPSEGTDEPIEKYVLKLVQRSSSVKSSALRELLKSHGAVR